MKFRGDDRELLRGLWSAVRSAGGSPSVNMIQKMARLAGASFDDKAARTVLFGDSGNVGNTKVTPQYLRTNTEVAPRRVAVKGDNGSIVRKRADVTEVTPQYLRTNTEVAPRRLAEKSNRGSTGDDGRADVTEAAPQYLRTNTEVALRRVAVKNNSDSVDRNRTDVTEAAPQYLRTNTEVAPRCVAAKSKSDSTGDDSRTDVTEAAPQYLRTNTEVAPRCGFGEAEESPVIDTTAPNLFDGLVDPLELEPVNDAVTLVPAGDIAPQEVLAPGIARLMELSKKAKAVNAAAAIRSAAKPTPKAIRYIFPSERKS